MPADPIRVLLIETNAEESSRVRSALEAEGPSRFEVREEPGLPSFSPATGAPAPEADIVLLGLDALDGDRLRALEDIRREMAGVPVVLLLGPALKGNSETLLRSAAADFVFKDAGDRTDLVRAIRVALSRGRAREELDAITHDLQDLHTRMGGLALIDPTTGLLNREGFDQVLALENQRAKRGGPEPVVALVLLDPGGRLEAGAGSADAAAIRRKAGALLKDSLRGTDYVARVSKDEFILLLPGTRTAEAMTIAERVRRRLGQGLPVPGSLSEGGRLGIALGITPVPQDFLSVDSFLDRSFSALDHKARSGGGVFLLGEAEGEERSPEIARLLGGEGVFRAVTEPIVSLETGAVVAVEFLSRGPEGPYEMPMDFFRVSREKEILTSVDLSCLKACVEASRAIDPACRCHINLFPSTLLDVAASDLFALFPPEFPRGRYAIEISELQIIGDPSYLVQRVAMLQAGGLQIALDDVGFGRSCLESLVLLKPDIVKVDRRFGVGIHKDPAKETPMKRMFNVATTLEAEVIAEGISDPKDLAVLKGLGLRYAQIFEGVKRRPTS